MPIEEKLSALTAEVQRLTAVTEKLVSLRVDAIETVRAEAAPAPTVKSAAASKKAAEAPAADANPAAAAAEAKPAAAPPKITLDEMKEIVAGTREASDDDMRASGAFYVTFGGSDTAPVPKDDATARINKVRSAILEHEKIKAKTLAEIDPKMRRAAVKKIVEFVEELQAQPEAAEADEL